MIDLFIFIILGVLFSFLALIFFVILLILSTDLYRDKCELCKKKIEHKGYDFVYCEDCKHKTYDR